MKILTSLLFILAFVHSAWATPELVKEKACGQCHRFTPDQPEGNIKGPDLFYAGNKLRKEWLMNYLQKPEPIRQAGYITDPGFLKAEPEIAVPHPSLNEEEAKKMADYLSSLKFADLPEGVVDSEPLSKGKRVRTKIKFERSYGCSSCHQTINLAGKIRGGVSGPSLVDAGNRLQADWVFHWLTQQKKFQKKTRMPVFQLEKDVVILLTKYIMSMKKENLK